MILQQIVVGFLVAVAVATQLTRISLYGRPLEEAASVELGHIELNSERRKALFLPSRTGSIEHTSFCVGTADVRNSDCFVVTSSLAGKQFVVQLDSRGDIDYLTVVDGPESAQVLVREAAVRPTPIMRPNNLAKSQREKETKKVQTQVDDDGNVVEVDVVEEDTRLWIQKNWMYIVPPLLILFVITGDDKPQS